MTILDKIKNESSNKSEAKEVQPESSSSSQLKGVEGQFKDIMDEFRLNTGFSINTAEPPADTIVEILSSKSVMVSITLLLAYIRHCVNNGEKKDITVKIGYNKPPSVPMNFAINDEILEEIYPGDVVEIN